MLAGDFIILFSSGTSKGFFSKMQKKSILHKFGHQKLVNMLKTGDNKSANRLR